MALRGTAPLDSTACHLLLGRTRIADVKNPDFMRTIQRTKFGISAGGIYEKPCNQGVGRGWVGVLQNSAQVGVRVLVRVAVLVRVRVPVAVAVAVIVGVAAALR